MKQSISEAFIRSIKNGTGESILILKENPSLDLDKHITHACTHNLAYDPQCEGSREEYLHEILCLAQNKSEIVSFILSKLLSTETKDWDLDLVSSLSGVLAVAGNADAYKAIYTRYPKGLEPEFEFINNYDLVILDGLKGLEFIAEMDAKQLAIYASHWIGDSAITLCEETFPHSSPRKHLEDLAKESSNIRVYLENLPEEEKEDTAKTSRKPRPDLTIVQLLVKIDANIGFSPLAGKRLTEVEIQILNGLIDPTQDDDKLIAYLRLLARSEYPVEIRNILPVLNSKIDSSRFFALQILSKVTDLRIRKIIDDNTSNIPFLRNHLELFVSNFKQADLSTIHLLAESLKSNEIDVEEVHSFVMTMKNVIASNEEFDFTEPLQSLYSVNNCSICREDLIKLSMATKPLPQCLLQELEHDCEPDLRSLAIKKRKKPHQSD